MTSTRLQHQQHVRIALNVANKVDTGQVGLGSADLRMPVRAAFAAAALAAAASAIQSR